MESLDSSSWDVVIAGTGLQESLLALALSRSGKRVLHVDRNDYYGGPDAALSLQDAEEWVVRVNQEAQGNNLSAFSNASITQCSSQADAAEPKLSFSRAYSLALSPTVIYSRSVLLPTLVSAKVDTQLEFLAFGSFWTYVKDVESRDTLIRLPNSREDVFADQSISMRSKRGLSKFLRFIMDFEAQAEIWDAFKSLPLKEFLSRGLNLPPDIFQPIQTLALSSDVPNETTTSYALPRIARHLRSIGLFGRGFGAVVPKWGGLAEIAQVGCRAGAVGGGVYVLGNGIVQIDKNTSNAISDQTAPRHERALRVQLKTGASITTDCVVGSKDNIPHNYLPRVKDHAADVLGTKVVSRSVSIVSSPLASLFPVLAEGSQAPAGAMVALAISELPETVNHVGGIPPVHVIVHSSDTGECPIGQCVLYGSVAERGVQGFALLERAIDILLRSVAIEESRPRILWRLQYEQSCSIVNHQDVEAGVVVNDHVIALPFPGPDLAFDDSVVARVEDVWRKIMEPATEGFMVFETHGGH